MSNITEIPPTLSELMRKLNEIQATLEALSRQPPASAQPAPARSYPASSRENEVYPQPITPVHPDIAGLEKIHFGKNAGVELASLSDNQLAFYAKEKSPQLKSDGTPFDPRPADVKLEQAARSLWHARKRTLQGSSAVASVPLPPAPPPSADNIPF
jgi:hypothetical protein